MDLCEWDAKSLLRAYGLPVPHARLFEREVDAPGEIAATGIIKAQTLFGGRGKAGLVRLAGDDPEATVAIIGNALAERGLPQVMMIEQASAFVTELYLSVVLDDLAGTPVLMFSNRGGIDIEDNGNVHSLPLPVGSSVYAHELVDFFISAGAPTAAGARLARLAADLVRMFRHEDMTMIEINPLVVTGEGRLMALDCKATLDDSARYRHRDRPFDLSRRLADFKLSPDECRARDAGYVLVQSPGDVVLITAGAGLGMMVADLLADSGFKAATFFDNASGARGETAEARLEMAWKLAESDEIKAIMFYQALSTRDLAPRVMGLLERLKAAPPPKPFYFGLSASFVAEKTMSAIAAREAITAAGCPAFEFPEQVVERMAADRDAGTMRRAG
jgi:succinyl-CoA synthetase beta subunit